MMGRISRDQEQLFYSFNLEDVVPDDHSVRTIAVVLDLAWVRAELAPHYSHTGRPSIDPVLMIRRLIVGYVFVTRSERALHSSSNVWAIKWGKTCISEFMHCKGNFRGSAELRSGYVAPIQSCEYNK